jgi:hypothetical protein
MIFIIAYGEIKFQWAEHSVSKGGIRRTNGWYR